MHAAGVVSRVPRSSRIAQAGGTDRNTDRTGCTHPQGQDGTTAVAIGTVDELGDGKGEGGGRECPENGRKWDSSLECAGYARGIGHGHRAPTACR